MQVADLKFERVIRRNKMEEGQLHPGLVNPSEKQTRIIFQFF